ncbi:MAG TPA: ADOP family duplicated permease [Longimicrobiales bacterium]|nr:ADOP family duplicated permease [Longimicrobiales bacterium]
MAWIPDRYRELRRLVRGERPDEELAEEFAFHVSMRVEENVARGMAPEAARREAERRFGDAREYREATLAIDHDMARERRRMESWGTLIRQVRLAARSLARSPGFTVVAVVTLALALGATVAVFSLVDRVVLRPLRYPAAERLVWIDSPVPGLNPDWRWGISEGGYWFLRRNARTLGDLGVVNTGSLGVGGGDAPAEQVSAAFASGGLMRVLGARPILGRPILPSDEVDSAGVVVLGYDFWARRYGRDREILGKTIEVSGRPARVVGVLARGFQLPDQAVDLWIPIPLDSAARPVNSHYLNAIARVKPGVPLAAVQAELDRLTARFVEAMPSAYSPGFVNASRFRTAARPLRDYVLGDSARTLWMLLGAVALVLLIACANIANLFLARAEAQRREVAVRTALGASRRQLAARFLAETLLLALAAGLLGLGLAWAGLRVLLRLAPTDLPRIAEVGIGGASVGFAAALCLLVALAFAGVLYARSRGPLLMRALREGGRGTTPGRQFVRRALTVTQVALALVLLAGAGLLLQSFLHLRGVDPGIRAEGALTLDVALPGAKYPERDDRVAFYDRLRERVAAIAGVQAVGLAQGLPMQRDLGPFKGGGCASLRVGQGDERGIEAGCMPTIVVSPGYFRAMGIPLLAGREREPVDDRNRTGAAVLSQALARQLFRGQDPIGHLVGPYGTIPLSPVVGVAGDVRGDGLDKPPYPVVYIPYRPAAQYKWWGWDTPDAMTLVVRAPAVPTARLVQEVRRAVAELDPSVPVANIAPLSDVVARSDSVVRRSFTLLLLGLAAGMALLLSGVGIYGVIAYLVAQRRAEIGVRMALGAGVGQIGRLVVLQSAKLAGAGVAVGLVAALAATRLLSSLLFDVRPTDPLTLGAVTLALLAVALLASYLPARRAARIDPVEALRSE